MDRTGKQYYVVPDDPTLRLDPKNFRKEEEAIIDAYNKSSKMPNIPLLNILEKYDSSRKLKGIWSWELPLEKIEDTIEGDYLNLEIIKSPWTFEL